MDAIFSLKPYFAEAILDGSKTVELRTVAPSKPVERVWIYATAPQMKILGHFRPGEIRHATADDCKRALVPDVDLSRFFAIEICDPVALEPPINPRGLDLDYLWLSPQSWRYAGKQEEKALRGVAP